MLFKECYLSTYSLTDHVYISVSSRAYVRRFVPVIVFKLKKKKKPATGRYILTCQTPCSCTCHFDLPNRHRFVPLVLVMPPISETCTRFQTQRSCFKGREVTDLDYSDLARSAFVMSGSMVQSMS